MFTYGSLEVLTKEKLLKIASYKEVPNVKVRMKKGDIIEAILKHERSKELGAGNGEMPPASVRIQRIRESQE